MIYLDNAATTLTKPPEVVEAVARALSTFGGVGRGVHSASLAAGMAVFDAREQVAALFGASSSSRVAFALNATMALNEAISGMLPAGGRAVTTAASHNSVLRPLFKARDERGCTVDVVPINGNGAMDFAAYEHALERHPDVVVATHASNLTGDVYDIARMARLAHEVGARFVLDAAQTAGALSVNMDALGVDVLCLTGHKGLFGPQGTGGLVVAEGVEIEPLLEGGSGVHSFDERQPRFMPELLEAGTLNAHGLAGLAAGVAFVAQKTPEAIHARIEQLTRHFEESVQELPGVRILGGHGGIDRCGIVALNVSDRDSAEVADRLASGWGIAVRAGAHCAPLMHRALGTEEQGAVRFSFSYFNTAREIDEAIAAMAAIAEEGSFR